MNVTIEKVNNTNVLRPLIRFDYDNDYRPLPANVELDLTASI